MRTVLTAAAILGLICSAPAMAQSTTSQKNEASSPNTTLSTTASTASGATTPMAPGAMQRDVRNDLEKAGFTDIKVMPSSFLVRAKDKQGRPVMMVINPDSVTEITNLGHAGTGTTAKN